MSSRSAQDAPSDRRRPVLLAARRPDAARSRSPHRQPAPTASSSRRRPPTSKTSTHRSYHLPSGTPKPPPLTPRLRALPAREAGADARAWQPVRPETVTRVAFSALASAIGKMTLTDAIAGPLSGSTRACPSLHGRRAAAPHQSPVVDARLLSLRPDESRILPASPSPQAARSRSRPRPLRTPRPRRRTRIPDL